MSKYREISTDAELFLALASCECDGYDVVKQFRKGERISVEYAACLCGACRARRRPQGGWSYIKNTNIRGRLLPTVYSKDFSITGNPDGSPMNKE